MKDPVKKTDKTAQISELIGKFSDGLEQLRQRRSVVADLLEAARSKRREFIAKNPGEEVPSELRHSISIAEIDAKSTDEEILEYEAQIAEQEAALLYEQKRGEREAAAERLKAIAKAADAAGADLKTAVAAVAKACAALDAALPDDLAILDFAWHQGRPPHRTERGPASRREIVSMVLSEAIAHAVPTSFDVEYGYRSQLVRMFDLAGQPAFKIDHEPAPAVDAAAATRRVITDRLRRRAEQILAGNLPAELDDVPALPPIEPTISRPDLKDTEIFVRENFAYVRDERGRRAFVARRWVHRCPQLVADLAVERGLALRTDTPEGLDAYEHEREYRKRSMTQPHSALSLDDCIDLGDPLGHLPSADDKLLRDEEASEPSDRDANAKPTR